MQPVPFPVPCVASKPKGELMPRHWDHGLLACDSEDKGEGHFQKPHLSRPPLESGCFYFSQHADDPGVPGALFMWDMGCHVPKGHQPLGLSPEARASCSRLGSGMCFLLSFLGCVILNTHC